MTTIRVIDFETSGLEPPAVVVEVGYCDLVRGDDGEWGADRPQSWLCGAEAIPPEVRAVHHISLAELRGQAAFCAADLLDRSDHCAAIAAHNLEFEDKFLGDCALPRICTLKAALRVWPDAPAHSNSVLRYWLEDQGLLSLNPELAMPPHRAGPDAYVTAHILKALLATGATGKEMVAWTKLPRLLPKINFGKHKGSAWSDPPTAYLTWVADKSDLEADVKWNAQQELQRRERA